MFADDTNIFLSYSNLTTLETLVNRELSHLATWLKANKLSLNVRKTHYMVFSNKRSPAKIDLMIDNERIGETCKTKFLWVIIDNKLTWKDHINCISGKIAWHIGAIVEARKYLNKDNLPSLYYSFIYPYLTFCNQVWGNTCKTYLEKIIIQQNGVIKWKHFPRCWTFVQWIHRWIPFTKASYAELWCFFDLRLNKRLSKQSWGWWFETPSRRL